MQAVIYSRISDDPTGRAAGVERQADECRALAEKHGATVVAELADNDLSATTGKKRPGYDAVLELIRTRKVDTVIVWHTDRLYRLPRDLEPIIDLADDRKLRFLTVTSSEIDLNSAAGRMVARILAAASAQEVEHKAERQRSASDQRASRGLPTSRPGYGYERVSGSDRRVSDEAARIREVARLILDGHSLRSVARDLNERGIPSPRDVELARASGAEPQALTPWSAATLRQMLQRPSLAGLRTHRGRTVGEFEPTLHPAILTRDEHDRLKALFSEPSRRTTNRGRAARYLLSGIAICGRCGGKMLRIAPYAPPPESRQKPTSAAYACSECHRVRRKQDAVDELVESVIVARLEKDDAVDLFAEADRELAQEASDSLSAIDSRLAIAADQFAEGVLTGDQLRRITEKLKHDRATAEAAYASAMPPLVPAGIAGSGARDVWNELPMDAKRSVLNMLVRVTIEPAKKVGRNSFDPTSVRIEWVTEP